MPVESRCLLKDNETEFHDREETPKCQKQSTESQPGPSTGRSATTAPKHGAFRRLQDESHPTQMTFARETLCQGNSLSPVENMTAETTFFDVTVIHKQQAWIVAGVAGTITIDEILKQLLIEPTK